MGGKKLVLAERLVCVFIEATDVPVHNSSKC